MRALAMAGGLIAMLLAGATAAGHAATVMRDQFSLTSPDIKPYSKIADKFVANGSGCTGENVSPALSWSGAPKGTKSFVLTVYDPDAPTGSGFWHWSMFDIPADVTSLPEGAGEIGKQPAGATQNRIDAGIAGYSGPCPPKGDKPHRYYFTIYAVKTDKLGVPEGSTAAIVGFLTHFAMIGKASFMATYGR